MHGKDDFLLPEDYTEPVCPLCMEERAKIDIRRVLDRLESIFAKNDAAGAERHLLYWLSEAETVQDTRAVFTLENELAGFYRKQQNREKALVFAGRSLDTASRLDLLSSLSGVNCLINAATVYTAFGHYDKAEALFEQGIALFDQNGGSDTAVKSSLLNNSALALAGLGKAAEALKRLDDVLLLLDSEKGTETEKAVSLLNKADILYRHARESEPEHAYAAEKEAEQCAYAAREVLLSPFLVRNAKAAYVISNCAAAFGSMGFFLWEEEMRAFSDRIYQEL